MELYDPIKICFKVKEEEKFYSGLITRITDSIITIKINEYSFKYRRLKKSFIPLVNSIGTPLYIQF